MAGTGRVVCVTRHGTQSGVEPGGANISRDFS